MRASEKEKEKEKEKEWVQLTWMGKPDYSKGLEKDVKEILERRADTVWQPFVGETGMQFSNRTDTFCLQFENRYAEPMVYTRGVCESDNLAWTDTAGLVLFAVAVHSRSYGEAAMAGTKPLALADGFGFKWVVAGEDPDVRSNEKMTQFREWFEKNMPGSKMAGESVYA